MMGRFKGRTLEGRAARLIALAVAAASVAAWASFSPGLAAANIYTFNTTTAQLSSDALHPAGSGTAFGDAFFAALNSGVADFTFNGNVTFAPGDQINVIGNNPLDIVSYNNITIPDGVTINVSASDVGAVAGGGAGGLSAAGGGGGGGGAEALSGVNSSLRAVVFAPADGGFGGAGGSPGACPSNGRDWDGSEMSRMRGGGSSRL